MECAVHKQLAFSHSAIQAGHLKDSYILCHRDCEVHILTLYIIYISLVAEGRLEISGGSWVMTDEATPYFWAAIDNMIVGHQYVQQILNITPTTSW